MGKISQIGAAGPHQSSTDVLTEILRAGSHRLLAAALEAEIEEFLARYADEKDRRGRQRVVRNGYHRPREVQTGIGAIQVQAPRVRDRESSQGAIKFTSAILPPYLRRSKSIEDLLPWLYLKGVSTGDFGDALAALLGPDAPGLLSEESDSGQEGTSCPPWVAMRPSCETTSDDKKRKTVESTNWAWISSRARPPLGGP